MKITISIIIPVYQVERYILDCLRSVVREIKGDGERVKGDGEACGQVNGERLADERMSGERLAVNEVAAPLAVSGERLAVSGESLRSGEGERVTGDGGASRGLAVNDERTFSFHPDDCKEEESRMMAEGTLHPSPFTRHNTEVILVDDCGSDRSIALAEEYLQGIPRLNYRILHHTHNQGLSAARNTGLAAAQGEYVYFLDSDDEILPGALTTLLQPLKDVKYDLVVGDYVEMKGDGEWVKGEGEASLIAHRSPLTESEGTLHPSPFTLHPSPFTLHPLSMLRRPTGPVMGNEEILKGYATGEWYVMAWNKLCRREFLITNGLWFEEGLLHEDVVWTFKVACLAKSMYVAKVPTYFYRTREASIMTGMSIEKDVSIYVEAMERIAEFLRKENRTEGRWEYHKLIGDSSRILYSLLQRGEKGLYRRFYPRFYGQCPASPWRMWRRGLLAIGHLLRDAHYLLPMACGRIYKEWFYNICYRMRNKRIEGAVWD